jgi:hypothetical protein
MIFFLLRINGDFWHRYLKWLRLYNLLNHGLFLVTFCSHSI